MKKKYLFLTIIICFILITIGSYAQNNVEKKKKAIDYKKILIGFWSDQFPASSGYGNGYIFREDNTFIYTDVNPYNTRYKYDGCSGKWKIENYLVKILVEKCFYWKKDWIVDDNIGWDSGEDNSLYAVKSKIVGWVVIGDVRFFTKGKIIKNTDKTLGNSIPGILLLKPIINDQISSDPYTERLYWHLFANYLDVPETKNMIESYQNIH